MPRKRTNYSVIAIGGLMIVSFFFIVRYPAIIGMDPTAGNTLFQLFPGLFLVSVCIIGAAESNGAARAGAVLFVGIGLSYLLGQANTLGLVTAEMLSGLTIAQLQIWVVIFGTISGVISYIAG